MQSLMHLPNASTRTLIASWTSTTALTRLRGSWPSCHSQAAALQAVLKLRLPKASTDQQHQGLW